MKKYLFLLTSLLCFNVFSQELVIGEERIEPGIKIIFEGAIKDIVFPRENNLDEEKDSKLKRGKKNNIIRKFFIF